MASGPDAGNNQTTSVEDHSIAGRGKVPLPFLRFDFGTSEADGTSGDSVHAEVGDSTTGLDENFFGNQFHGDKFNHFEHNGDPWVEHPLQFDPTTRLPVGVLGTYLRSGLLNRRSQENELNEVFTPLEDARSEILQQAATHGLPDLTYPAQQYLDLLKSDVPDYPNRVVGSRRS